MLFSGLSLGDLDNSKRERPAAGSSQAGTAVPIASAVLIASAAPSGQTYAHNLDPRRL
jgi:hypothetical protein